MKKKPFDDMDIAGSHTASGIPLVPYGSRDDMDSDRTYLARTVPVSQDDVEDGAAAGHTLMADALTTFDVFAMVVNKVVGTGIFTAPSLVLALTESRGQTIGLWVVGLVSTILSMLVYLEFAAVLPFNTGELLYLDEATSYDGQVQITSRTAKKRRYTIRRHLGNGLGAFTVYGIAFTILFNSGTNSLQIGWQILICVNPHEEEPHHDLVRFIAIVAFTSVCILHYHSAGFVRALNKCLCGIKLTVWLVLLVMGIKRSIVGPKIGFPRFIDVHETFSGYSHALLFIMFSFGGWENASFVPGEIPESSQKVLRHGSLSGLTVVGIMYLALNIVYVYSVDFDDEIRFSGKNSFATQLFGNSRQAIQGWAVLEIIFALGSLISIVHCFSRVKQAVGAANILPFSNFWKQDCPKHNNDKDPVRKTPRGGLLLHWLSTISVIVAMVAVQNTLEMVTFPGILQVYTHCIIFVLLSLGLFALKQRATALNLHVGSSWLLKYSGFTRWLIISMICLNCFCIVFIIVTYLMGPSSDTIPHWTLPAVIGTVLLLAAIYYLAVFWSSASARRVDLQPGNSTPTDSQLGLSLLGLADVICIIHKDEVYHEENERTSRFGTRRLVKYEHINEDDQKPLGWILYWAFGGKVDTSPPEKIGIRWGSVTQSVSDRVVAIFQRQYGSDA